MNQKKHKWAWGVGAAFLLLVVMLVYVRANTFVVSEAGLSGTIYASMAESGESVSLMQLAVSNQTAAFESFLSIPNTTLMQLATANFAGGKHAFYTFLPGGVVTDAIRSNIIHTNPTGDIDMLLPIDNDLVKERDLTFSVAANKLAFSAQTMSVAQTAATDDIDSVAQWGVYTVDFETKELQFIGSGKDPQWNPEGTSLVYMKADGLYEYILASDENVPVQMPAGFSAAFGENANIAVSSNGSMFALAAPNDGLLAVGEVTTWSPVTIENITAIAPEVRNRTYFWPTFSPNGKYLAVQSARVQSGGMGDQIIEIIDTETKTTVQEIDISQYDFDRAFIDEWSN